MKVWTGHDAGVEHNTLRGIFATYESARRWLEEERERQIADLHSQWEYWQKEYAVGSEWRESLKAQSPEHDWDAHFEEELAKPPVTVTEIVDDECENSDGGIHGVWYIKEWEVQP